MNETDITELINYDRNIDETESTELSNCSFIYFIFNSTHSGVDSKIHYRHLI